MPRLDFDFHARASRPARLGAALALVGVVALGWALSNMQASRATEAGLAAQISAIGQAARPHLAAKPVTHADEVGQVTRSRVAAQLAYSWQPAFDALAATRSGKIALVSLEAVQAKAQLKLVAEARQLSDAVAFIDALQQQPGVKRVGLTQHEIRTDDPQKPVRVNILVELDT